MPVRVQRRRTKGWKWPEDSVYVGRPTAFGNPFSVTQKVKARARVGGGRGYRAVPTVEDAVECYRLYLDGNPELVRRVKDELRGRDLMCWSPLDRPCNADILLEIANS